MHACLSSSDMPIWASLELDSTSISDTGLADLTGLGALKWLTIDGGTVTSKEFNPCEPHCQNVKSNRASGDSERWRMRPRARKALVACSGVVLFALLTFSSFIRSSILRYLRGGPSQALAAKTPEDFRKLSAITAISSR